MSALALWCRCSTLCVARVSSCVSTSSRFSAADRSKGLVCILATLRGDEVKALTRVFSDRRLMQKLIARYVEVCGRVSPPYRALLPLCA
jgi:hypothetical protein